MITSIATTHAYKGVPSLEFILRGVESSGLYSCAQDPVYVPDEQNSAISSDTSSNSLGGAWGDFNGDGWDDLYVARLNTRSTLYRNDRGILTDVTSSSGLPAKSSSSGLFADYDNDRLPDLFVIESIGGKSPLEPDSKTFQVGAYRNKGDGTFARVTENIGLETPEAYGPSIGAMSFADYDRDGDLDLVLMYEGRQQLAFSVENIALLKSITSPRLADRNMHVTCKPDEVMTILRAAKDDPSIQNLEYVDIDSFVRQEGCLRFATHIGLTDTDTRLERVNPRQIAFLHLFFPGKVVLFENRSGMFRAKKELSAQIHGLASTSTSISLIPYERTDFVSGIYWQPYSFDYDRDGWTDILLAVDTGANVLFRNEGSLSFRDVSTETETDFTGSGMGVTSADYLNDGSIGFFVTNARRDYLYHATSTVFSNLTNTDSTQIDAASVGWGASFVDYDLDGWQDLFVVNGDHLIRSWFSAIQFLPSLIRPLFRSDALFRNDHGTFVADPQNLCPEKKSGRALAIADYNNDGTPDAFVGNISIGAQGPVADPPPEGGDVLYENTTAGRSYLTVRLHGTTSNSFGIGSIVRVTGNDMVQTRELVLGESFYSGNSQALYFGLGTSTEPVTVDVVWPSGKKTHKEKVPVGTIITITE